MVLTYERQIVLSSYNVAESTNPKRRFLFFSTLCTDEASRSSAWCAKIQVSLWTRVARSSRWHSASSNRLQCKGKSNGELLAYVSFRDGKETRRVICYLTLPLCWLSLQRDYAIRVKHQVERVTNYLLTSPR